MTLTLPDMATPAQPPTGGLRELLAFTGVTAAVYVLGALALAVIAGVT